MGEGASAETLRLTQETRYPWDGRIRISVTPAAPFEFTLNIRIPGWAQGKPVPGDLYRYAEKEVPAVTLSVNGRAVSLTMQKGYAVLRRAWKPGDTIELNLPMPIHRVLANQGIEADRGRVALERGPLVYCVEGTDNGGRARTLALPADAELIAEYRKNLLGGITVVRAQSTAASPFTAIPYYAWSNRGDGEMCVWLPAK